MKKSRHIILILLAALITAARFSEHIGEWYAVTIYPRMSAALSLSASCIPVSMEEILVVAAVILMIVVGIELTPAGERQCRFTPC